MCECLNKYFSIIFCPPHIFPLPVHTNTTRSYERTSKMNHTNNNTKYPNDARKRRIRENSHYNEKDQPAPDNNLFWEDASNPLSSKGN